MLHHEFDASEMVILYCRTLVYDELCKDCDEKVL